MNKSSLIIASVALLAMFQAVSADSRAQQECKSIHHMDIDPQGTEYVNNNCMLRCNVHGKIYAHYINEGKTCMIGHSTYVCRNGQCNGGGSGRNGHIDIEIISASLYRNAYAAYASATIRNNSQSVHLPLTADERRGAVACSTQTRTNTNYPQWNEICSGTSRYVFPEDARVTVEVWDHLGQGNNKFLGGVTLTIDQMLNHGDNHRVINMAMAGGDPGQLTMRITYTPNN